MRAFARCLAGLLAWGALTAGCGGEADAPGAPRGGVVVMGPNLTETIFALGQGHRVSAVGRYCDYPPEAAALPRVGGYIDPDLEKITMLRPELIVLAGEYPKVTEFAARMGIRVANVDMDSLGMVKDGITRLGVELDCADRAAALRAAFERREAALARATRDLPKPEVLVITGRSGHNLDTLNTVGGETFLSEVVALAGGRNIHADERRRYFEASKETIVMRAPDAIVEFHPGEALTPEAEAAFRADWAALPSLPAVRAGRILILTEPHAMRPGPRILDIAARIARFLHPDAELPE
jgi:iron complex transport system substrate-binding protein